MSNFLIYSIIYEDSELIKTEGQICVQADFLFQLNFLPPYSLHSQGDEKYNGKISAIKILYNKNLVGCAVEVWKRFFYIIQCQ